MNDDLFQSLLNRTSAAQRKFQTLLDKAEAEYKRRYGANPSDVDDDAWIDALTGSCGEAMNITVAQVEEGATLSGLTRIEGT